MFATRLKKRPRDDSFWKCFWSQNRSNIEKRALGIVTKINSIFNQIFIWFWLHFGPHGPPQNSTFFIIFCSWCHSWAILAPRGAQSAPRRLQSSIFQEICTILGSIFEGFRKISKLIFLYNSLLNFQIHVLFSMTFQQGCFNSQLYFWVLGTC